MSRDDHIRHLGSVPLFADLDSSALEHVAARSNVVTFPAGAILIERGTPGSGMFVLLEGSAEVELRNGSVEVGTGDFVGELSLLTDDPRSARVRAATDVTCLAIGRADFAELLHSEPNVALVMLSTLARRLHDHTA